jgi:hypothetical protein
MPDYQIPASKCPLVKFRSTIHNPLIDPPTTFTDQALLDSDVQQLRPKFNQTLVMIEEIAGIGAGAWAVASGIGGELRLSLGTGLNISVGTGVAMLDGPVIPQDDHANGVDDIYCYVWAMQGGFFDVVTSADPDVPPAPPSDIGTYIGRARIQGGDVTEVDHSGVLMIKGGLLWRKVGDAGAPTDTPPASLIILTVTQGGTWLWTGTQYVNILDSGDLSVSA